MKGIDTARVRAVYRKELRDYRRKRSIVLTMIFLPIPFMIEPLVSLFLVPPPANIASAKSYVLFPILYLLLIPSILPSIMAAYTIVGEREQGTLEPLLTTPIREQELIAGKAIAVLAPTMMISYAVYAIFLIALAIFGKPIIITAVFHQPAVLLILFLLSPLLAGWAIAVGMAISVRATEVRVAQQLATFASFPPVIVIMLLAVGVIHPTFSVALIFAATLLLIDTRAVRIVSKMMNRERLITGSKP